MPEFPWENLLRQIEDRRVVPVVGADLSMVPQPLGRARRLIDVLGEKACTTLDLPRHSSGWNGALRAFRHARCRRQEVVDAVCAAYEHPTLHAVPEALLSLADISDFDTFISTATDTLLAVALHGARQGNVVSYETKLPGHLPDIPSSLLFPSEMPESRKSLLYQFFGAIGSDGCFSLNDEDLLEFMFRYHRNPPANLFDFLGQRNLLLIGNSFPDWLARFFARLLRGKPFSEERAPWIGFADECSRQKCDRSLIVFLEQFGQNPIVYDQGGAREFVRELHRRWKKRRSATLSQPAITGHYEVESMVSGSVFISYARENAQAAQNVYDFLQDKVDVWLDRKRLHGGVPFEAKIMRHIEKCDLFIPILSKDTVARPEGFVFLEWDKALDRQRRIQKGPFIYPLVIDHPAGNCLAGRAEPFRTLHRREAANGMLDEETVLEIVKTVREVRILRPRYGV